MENSYCNSIFWNKLEDMELLWDLTFGKDILNIDPTNAAFPWIINFQKRLYSNPITFLF